MGIGFSEGEDSRRRHGAAEPGVLEPSVDEPPGHATASAEPPSPEAEPEAAPESQPEPDSQAATTEELVEALARIEDTLAESQRLIDRQTEVAARLHAENQTLRAGELRTAQAGLVSSVLRVYDDVSRMAATSEDPAAERDLGMVAEALVDALERNGIDRMPVAAGDRFEPGRHKVAEVEATDDADVDRTVARVVRDGFAWSDGTVVRVSDVVVHRCQAPAAEPASADAASDQPAD